MTATHEPLDTDISEYGQTLYAAGGELPRTSKLQRCACGAWHWLPSDGAEVWCECGLGWAQRPVGSIVRLDGNDNHCYRYQPPDGTPIAVDAIGGEQGEC